VKRERFKKLVAQALDGLPAEFRQRIRNVAILVEDVPPSQRRPGRPRGNSAGPRARPRRLLMGVFVGVPTTQKSVWDLSAGPDHIILYQKNIESVCASDDEIREEVRLTLLHELGHYFGMSEEQLRDL
jgi:predicted Zn-dependent protease with MMP-like domain